MYSWQRSKVMESNLTTPIKIKNTYTFKPSNPSPRSLFSQKKKNPDKRLWYKGIYGSIVSNDENWKQCRYPLIGEGLIKSQYIQSSLS